MTTIDTATFLRGVQGNKKDEAILAETFKKNIEFANTQYPNEQLIVTEHPLSPWYQTLFSSTKVMQTHYYGYKEQTGVALHRISKDLYDDLISKNLVKFFAKKGSITASSKISRSTAETYVNIKSAASTIGKVGMKTIETTAKAAFYSTLFVGVNNLFGLNSGLVEEIFPFVPDILVGTMPFFSVQRIERGMSERLLKYRAIGDVFLAHQRGATDTLRVDLTLVGPYRGWYLLFLLMLQGRGESQLKELAFLGEGPDITFAPPHEIIKIPKKGKVKYESHKTFPVITKTAFMLDMFLQTIEWHQEKDRGGHNVIYVHLLFRKHIDPKGYTLFDKDSKGYLNYGDTQSERLRKEVLLDTIWKAREIGNELFNVGMFGARNMFELDRETIASDPYMTDIMKLANGYTFDLNDLGVII